MRKQLIALVVVAGITLGGCGQNQDGTTPFSGGPSMAVKYDSLPSEHQAIVDADLKVLGGLPLSQGDTSVLEVSEFSGRGFTSWLSPRVKYVIGKNYNYATNLPEPSGSYYTYYSRTGSTLGQELQREDMSTTFAMNVGATIHSASKTSRVTYTMQVAGDSVSITSPRSGIIGLYDSLFNGSRIIKSSSVTALANSLIRLMTVMHEGRHGDGNGANATFPHTSCQKSSSRICDASLNGPNGVSKAFITYGAAICTSCTDRERQGLNAVLGDVSSRIRTDAVQNDVTPEGI
jgi:hypothetical protein